MEYNTQLPKEVEMEIEQEAEAYANKTFIGKTFITPHAMRKAAFIEIATPYATKLHQVQQENAKLKEQATGWRPLLEDVLKYDAAFGELSIELIDKIKKFLYGE